MKVREAIDMAKRMKPNAFGDETILRWLNECEGRVQVEIHQIAPENARIYTLPEDDMKVLLIQFPFDRLYWMYLIAMIDYANGEYNSYQNAMQKVNAALKEYHAWWMRNKHNCREG